MRGAASSCRCGRASTICATPSPNICPTPGSPTPRSSSWAGGGPERCSTAIGSRARRRSARRWRGGTRISRPSGRRLNGRRGCSICSNGGRPSPLLPHPVVRDPLRQVVEVFGQVVEELNHIPRILRVGSLVIVRFGMRRLITELPHLVRPLLHERRQRSLPGQIINLVHESLALGALLA